MAPRRLPDVAYVRECLDYDPATGLFHWRQRALSHFPDRGKWGRWNGRWAGVPAGGYGADGYLRIHITGVGPVLAHRIAWLIVYGELPAMLDHIDGDPTNNRITNLRAATYPDNMANARMRKDNTLGAKGVDILPSGAFRVRIKRDGKRYHVGVFATLEQAVAARREAAEQLQGEFARHD